MGIRLKRIASLALALAFTLGMANRAADLSAPARAEKRGMRAICAMEFQGSGWSGWTDGALVPPRAGSFPTSFKAGLVNQPDGMSGTIQYQANISGRGWSGTRENTAPVENEGGTALVEGVRVWLNGDLQKAYDVYASALVGGEWLDWAANGQDAGRVGVGTHLDGICIAVVGKGEQPPRKPGTAAGARALDLSKPMVALTFDDGPAEYDRRILTALEAAGGRGTFFLVGKNIAARRDIVRRMAEGGHEIGNHSWSHPSFSKLSEKEIRFQIQKTNEEISSAAGSPARLVRPPYGALGGQAKPTLAAMGYAASLWSIDTLDWKTRNADRTVSAVLNQVKDGDVILMHSLYAQSAEAVERMAPELVRRGYQLVTLSELAGARGGMTPGKAYGAFR